MRASVTSSQLAEQSVLTVTGDVDFGLAPYVGTPLLDALAPGSGSRGVVVDLSAVNYVDSMGLSVLVHAASLAARERREFSLVLDGNRRLEKLLRMTGLTDAFAVHDTLAAALGTAVDDDLDAVPA
ncbi:anti-anti-sigma factor [Frankineae bacterium MT45]|nr:anti-anti-sigma factor [Frankineae bacterium MT45]